MWGLLVDAEKGIPPRESDAGWRACNPHAVDGIHGLVLGDPAGSSHIANDASKQEPGAGHLRRWSECCEWNLDIRIRRETSRLRFACRGGILKPDSGTRRLGNKLHIEVEFRRAGSTGCGSLVYFFRV